MANVLICTVRNDVEVKVGARESYTQFAHMRIGDFGIHLSREESKQISDQLAALEAQAIADEAARGAVA